jgi:hypothetical protein
LQCSAARRARQKPRRTGRAFDSDLGCSSGLGRSVARPTRVATRKVRVAPPGCSDFTSSTDCARVMLIGVLPRARVSLVFALCTMPLAWALTSTMTAGVVVTLSTFAGCLVFTSFVDWLRASGAHRPR